VKHVFTLIASILLMIAIPGAEVHGQGNNFEETFFKANNAYKEGRYEDAVKDYNDLIKAGYGSGHIYYNLGNAFFRQDQLGKAILNYERAKILIPRDADLSFNLNYARDQVQDEVTEEQGFMKSAFFWTESLTMKELFWGFVVLNLLFWSTLFIRLFTRQEWTYYITIVLLIFWFIGGVSFGLKFYWHKTDNRAVILNKQVNILAGPDSKDTILFKLHEGTIVHQERSEGGWSLISLPDNKRGWVKAGSLELISPAPARVL
jgi:hypothetical protein